MTMIYVIIGLACGLGIPLVAVLIWFIVKKFRFFKEFDPEEMEIDDYIKLKKGLAIDNVDVNGAETLGEINSNTESKSEDNNVSDDINVSTDSENNISESDNKEEL